jgi:branched-chain amino acid transport system ATP-binding protein
MFRCSNLNVSIGPIPIIRGASFALEEGEMCGLIGRNGAGKTTLFRAIMGAIPASGIAELRRTDLLSLPPHQRVAHGIGYMPEDRRLVPEFTVEENVRLPALSLKMSGADRRLDWVFGLIPEVAKFRDRPPLELSGGQQKMVALARALMGGSRMLLLDEPFEGLAPALARRLAEVLANLKSEGISVLLSESNEVHVVDLLSRVFRIERGSVSPA